MHGLAAPGGERLIQGCVLEGMLLGPTGGSLNLPYGDKVDWTKFEGQTVRFKKRFGRGINVLLTPPSAIGPCDPALVATALPRALGQRADNDSVREKNNKKGSRTSNGPSSSCRRIATLSQRMFSYWSSSAGTKKPTQRLRVPPACHARNSIERISVGCVKASWCNSIS